MKKILLLENEEHREEKLTVDLKKYAFVTHIFGDENCNTILDEFLEDKSKFNDYDTIIIHESIYDESKRVNLFEKLDNFCLNKNLIKFSGNNTQFSLKNECSLQLKPMVLYKNIEAFFKAYKEGNSNILMLALGEKWSLNILLNTLEKLNIFIENNTKDTVHKSIFSSKTGLSKIKEVIPESYEELFININSHNITREQIQKIAQKLQKLIKELAND